MAGRNKTSDFLRAMSTEAIPEAAPSAPVVPKAAAKPATVKEAVQPKAVSAATPTPTKTSASRGKHFGGYVTDDTLEKVALLKVRLKKDNSELITFAIDELYKIHKAKRAFGDA